jgi:hypothetical protein
MREGSREAFQAQAAYRLTKKTGDLSTKLPLALDSIPLQKKYSRLPESML